MVDSEWLEVALLVPANRVEAVEGCLDDITPDGMAIEEPYVPLGPDEGVRLEPWRPTIFKIYLHVDELLEEQRRSITARLATLPFDVETRERTIREEDWAQSWKEFFQVERVGRRLVIRPTWRDYTPQPDDLVLDLDPGMAFGTGQHATTRLCLRLLEDFVKPGVEALDLGCGSGILSLAAAKLGCARVLALDILPVAVEATRANAEANGVAATVEAELGSLGEAWPSVSTVPAFDLIVANINASIIAQLAPAIAAGLRPGGVFLGSGIIEERIDEPLLALAAAGLRIEDILAEGDWRATVARRDAPQGGGLGVSPKI